MAIDQNATVTTNNYTIFLNLIRPSVKQTSKVNNYMHLTIQSKGSSSVCEFGRWGKGEMFLLPKWMRFEDVITFPVHYQI